MCRATTQTCKWIRLPLSTPTPTTKKRQRPGSCVQNAISKRPNKSTCDNVSTRMPPRDPKRSEPTVLDLLSVIGERNQDLSNEALHNYMNRDFLKISQQWSQTMMRHDEELNALQSIHDEPVISSQGIVNSLSEECARLEVNAMALLASLENKMPSNDSTNDESWIEDDDGISEEIRNLEEIMKSLEEELRGAGDVDCSESDKQSLNVCELDWIGEDMIGEQIFVAACA